MAATSDVDLSKLRNIGIIAHIDAGKTTTTEHLLFYAGEKHKLGAVDSGTTETDYDAEEQQRGITIYSACVPLHWQDCTINLIDTPGHVDFTAEVERSLRVLDGAVCVFDAQKGVEAQSETVWRQANKYHVPRMVFINKMDIVGADFAASLADIRERLEGHPVPLFVPIGSGSSKDSATPFAGVIDLLEQQALYFEPKDAGRTIRYEAIPAELTDPVAEWREKLFDALTTHDEEDRITSAYLEGQEIAGETLRSFIRQLTIRGLIHPVFCGSGREHIGVQPLLDAVCWYLPSPLEVPPVVGIHPTKDKEEKRKADPKEPFCGLVFKVISSDHGDMFFIRIYSGRLKSNSKVLIADKNKKEAIGKLFHVRADPKADREDLDEAFAGDIVATMGLKEAVTGDTLCDAQHPIVLERITFAQAVVTQSVEPQSSADKDKLLDVLNKLQREDPTFLVKHDPETGQMVMSGMGTLHLEVKRNRMERDFRLKIRVGKPRVSYRETMRDATKTTGEFIRTTPTPMFARVTVEFSPAAKDQGIAVRSKLKPHTIPEEFVVAALEGLRSTLSSGEFGYPMLSVQATLLDAQMDQETSNANAFEAAAADAVAKAIHDNITLLEPIMRLEVAVPEEFVGNVTGDLSARRAEIQSIEAGKVSEIVAMVPLAKMFDYADKVRSLTQGRASSAMEPSHYAPAGEDVLRMLRGDDLD